MAYYCYDVINSKRVGLRRLAVPTCILLMCYTATDHSILTLTQKTNTKYLIKTFVVNL